MSTGSHRERKGRKQALRTFKERNDLIIPYLPLAWAEAQRAHRAFVSVRKLGMDDARQEAVVGLMRAGELYDPGIRKDFSRYARSWIHHKIMKAAGAEGAIRDGVRQVGLCLLGMAAPAQEEDCSALVDLSRLGNRQRRVIEMRLAGAQWKAIGRELGVSRQRALQLAHKAVKALGLGA